MKERDPLPLSPESRHIVDQPHTRYAALLQNSIKIGNREAYVMNSWSPPGDEFSNRSIRRSRLQQLDKRFSSRKGLDVRAVRIAYLHRIQSQYVAVKRKSGVKRLQCDSNVSDPDAMGG